MTERQWPMMANREGRPFYLALVIWLLIWLALFWGTLSAMVQTWIDAETYAHGFLIAPIALWLLWDSRERYLTTPLSPSLIPLLLVLAGSAAWFVASLVGVQVVQQLAAVGVFSAGVWSIVGHEVARRIWFPLAFLLFCVPMGQGLVPPLIELTADATVALVKLTGIPIYREGTFFSLPTGDWSVVAACSGVRYLIASVTLGCLFAYITYRSTAKRLGFIALSAVVPIVANVLRAFMIVMIGHFSNMELATGVDHLIYGWIFFGVVMLLLFSVGARWRDDQTDHSQAGMSDELSTQVVTVKARGLWLAMALLLLCSVLAPGAVLALNSQPLPQAQSELALPADVGSWHATDMPWSWVPYTIGAHHNTAQAYSRNADKVAIYIGHFLYQREGEEVIDRRSRIVEPGRTKSWRALMSLGAKTTDSSRPFTVERHVLTDRVDRLLVWSWYRVGDRVTNNPYIAKFYDALNRLGANRRDAARIYLATPMDNDPQSEMQAQARLEAFAESVLPLVNRSLDRVAGWDKS